MKEHMFITTLILVISCKLQQVEKLSKLSK